jgi:hypothetical protein
MICHAASLHAEVTDEVLFVEAVWKRFSAVTRI